MKPRDALEECVASDLLKEKAEKGLKTHRAKEWADKGIVAGFK